MHIYHKRGPILATKRTGIFTYSFGSSVFIFDSVGMPNINLNQSPSNNSPFKAILLRVKYNARNTMSLKQPICRAGLALLMTISMLWSGCQITTDTPTPPSSQTLTAQVVTPWHLRGFSLISESECPAVGKIVDENDQLIGSATLISPIHVLTAAHVVDGDNAACFVANDISYRIKQIRIHELASVAGRYLVDVALVTLEYPVAEKPIALWEGASRSIKQGEKLTIVGYGGGHKKKSISGDFWYYGVLLGDSFNFKLLCYFGTVWFGDSGGPVMLESTGELIGVVSALRINKEKGMVVDNSCVDVALVRPWILKHMAEDSIP